MDHVGKIIGQVVPFARDGSYFYQKGIEAYQNKQITRSKDFIRRAIQIEPEEPVFMCQLAIILSEEGDYEASTHWLQKIKDEVDPMMSECYFFLASNQVQNGDFEAAKENLEVYTELDETGDFQEDADALLYLIEVELGMEHTKSYGNNPFHSPVLMELHEGNYKEAEELARQIIFSKPELLHTNAMLAEAMWKQGKIKKAKKLLISLMEKPAADLFVQSQYTILLFELKSKEAQRWIDNLKQLYPLNRWERYAVGRALYHVAEYDAAYLLLRDAMPLELPVYVHQLAVSSARCGKYRKAQQLWKQAACMESEKQSWFLQLRTKVKESQPAGTHGLEWIYKNLENA